VAPVDPDLPAPGERRPDRPAIVFAIAAGGVGGTLARYGVTRALAVPAGSFPWATFLVNVSGSLVIGALLSVMLARWPASRYVRSFLAVGFLGAYTTFSTFVVEADVLVIDGHVAIAASYVVASLVAGTLAAWLGIAGARRVLA
jgi:fluoride exporter